MIAGLSGGNPTLMSQPKEMMMAQTKYFPPAIAVGCEPSIGLRLAHADARKEFRKIHGGTEVEYKPKGKLIRKLTYVGQITMASLAGCKLLPNVETNPRKPGTYGWRSMNIILSKPEIVLEAYLAMGGRMNDLRWDIDRGHVTVAR